MCEWNVISNNSRDPYKQWVIEDVPYRKLRYRGESLPLLREIDPAQIITMSSFSKLLSPGIRVGYMVAPAEQVLVTAAVTDDVPHSLSGVRFTVADGEVRHD